MKTYKNQFVNSARVLTWTASAFLALSPVTAYADSQKVAMLLFARLAGYQPLPSDPRIAQMVTLINKGDIFDAADIPTRDKNFIDVTVTHFASPMSNVNSDPTVPINDFVATMAGIIRDDIDARSFLTANYIYVSMTPGANGPTILTDPTATFNGTELSTDMQVYGVNPNISVANPHFNLVNSNFVSLNNTLAQVPQKTFNPTTGLASVHPDPAGLMTTGAWAVGYTSAGTNRRMFRGATRTFLCKDITDLFDNSLPDIRIRHDVTRDPNGDNSIFLNRCQGCHAGMDANSGAFAYYDFEQIPIGGQGGPLSGLLYTPGQVQSKMLKNSQNSDTGYTTVDDTWMNLFTANQNAAIGWGSTLKGNGMAPFGAMLANTQAFGSCMATQVFTEVCRRAPASSDADSVNKITTDFMSNGYNMRRLFKEAATLPQCAGGSQ